MKRKTIILGVLAIATKNDRSVIVSPKIWCMFQTFILLWHENRKKGII